MNMNTSTLTGPNIRTFITTVILITNTITERKNE